MGKAKVVELLKQFKQNWLADDYDLTSNNCVTFCRAMSEQLACGCSTGIPQWVDALARKVGKLTGAPSSVLEPVYRVASATSPCSSMELTGKPGLVPRVLPRIWQAANVQVQDSAQDQEQFPDEMPDIESPDDSEVLRYGTADEMPDIWLHSLR